MTPEQILSLAKAAEHDTPRCEWEHPSVWVGLEGQAGNGSAVSDYLAAVSPGAVIELCAKISELEDTLAATLENWEAYAAELGPELEECECDERHCPGTKPKVNESHCQAPQCLKFRARNDGAVWSSCARCGGTGLDPGYIPPPAPGECVECRASPGSAHHPNCSMGKPAPDPSCVECVTMGASCRAHGHWHRADDTMIEREPEGEL